MKKIIILDFSTAEVHVLPYDSHIFNDAEEFFVELAETSDLEFSANNCQWMITDDLNIKIH